MAIKYINILHYIALQNLHKLGFLGWKETIWQPCLPVCEIDWISNFFSQQQITCLWPGGKPGWLKFPPFDYFKLSKLDSIRNRQDQCSLYWNFTHWKKESQPAKITCFWFSMNALFSVLWRIIPTRVAWFLLMQHTQIGEKIYQTTIKYIKWPQNIPNGCEILQLTIKYASIFNSTQDPPKCTQIWIFWF
jgi:hypothetical protein